jgi:hypothetical protein
VAPPSRTRPVEQEFSAALTGQHDSPAMPLIGIEHYAVNRRRFVPAAGSH